MFGSIDNSPSMVSNIGIALAIAMMASPSFLILADEMAADAIDAHATAINNWRNNFIVRGVIGVACQLGAVKCYSVEAS